MKFDPNSYCVRVGHCTVHARHGMIGAMARRGLSYYSSPYICITVDVCFRWFVVSCLNLSSCNDFTFVRPQGFSRKNHVSFVSIFQLSLYFVIIKGNSCSALLIHKGSSSKNKMKYTICIEKNMNCIVTIVLRRERNSMVDFMHAYIIRIVADVWIV